MKKTQLFAVATYRSKNAGRVCRPLKNIQQIMNILIERNSGQELKQKMYPVHINSLICTDDT